MALLVAMFIAPLAGTLNTACQIPYSRADDHQYKVSPSLVEKPLTCGPFFEATLFGLLLLFLLKGNQKDTEESLEASDSYFETKPIQTRLPPATFL